jgi:hypothetical protein
MARDKSKDDNLFNCAQDYEHNYVAGLYSLDKRPNVRHFLLNGCASKLINHSTHHKVYQLIHQHLGYPIPD